ncbi:cupin domain-containing protein [Pedobacter sp. GR22-10]|jgi:quercetin dioxygenase-like cupin family protein|uniref:cupin domain-containing protein n=1 Tax=Pedobacter TaxID=84567 RepID=UPI002246C7B2|nr:cupin domain-containing protein [Pedobacter sp. GR22-10]MCX2429549.1 cupin domain-containing protein [Pedobacter sp. GR22-10]
MNKKLYVLIMLALAGITVKAQQTPIFPKGEKAPNVHHVGNVWLTELQPADSVFSYGTSVAIFDPGARLDWHTHPGGQILIITEGVGYYMERGKTKQTVRKGQVIRCMPGVEHWHGATPETGVTYIATSPTEKGKTAWLERVSDVVYKEKK